MVLMAHWKPSFDSAESGRYTRCHVTASTPKPKRGARCVSGARRVRYREIPTAGQKPWPHRIPEQFYLIGAAADSHVLFLHRYLRAKQRLWRSGAALTFTSAALALLGARKMR